MNKVELADLVAERARLTKKDATIAVDALFDGIVEALAKGEEVRVAGFGTIEVKERKPRQGVNPSTGEKMTIPAAMKEACVYRLLFCILSSNLA